MSNIRKLVPLVIVLIAAIALAVALGASSVTAQSADPAGIYRGVSTAVQFDVSPPLRSMTPLQAQPGTSYEIPERATGLEGPLGPQSIDPLVQSTNGPNLIPAPLISFNGPPNISSVSPPDPVGDVGPNHYVAMSNLSFQIFDKAGNSLYGPALNNTLWAGFGGDCQTDNSGDPIVLYDQFDDRWILTQFTASGPTYFNCVAVSQTGDPTGAYYRYAFSTGSNFPDYPKYGMWGDALYISTREFAGGTTFAGIGAYAVKRSDLISGNPAAQVISFLATTASAGGAYNIGDGLLPADADGPTPPPAGTPNFFVGSMDDGGQYGAPQDALTLWKFTADFVTPANSSFVLASTLPVAAFDSVFPCTPGSRDCIPQPGTSNKLDILSYRQRPMWRLAYRNFGSHESLVTNQAVEAATNMAGIRWYEIRDPNGAPTIYQQGTYAPGITDGIHRWMGSIAMDSSGNMALGYSASNATTTFPSVWYTGRLATDPLGTMPQGEGSIINGTGSQTGSQRWGDYTSMNIDPVDDCTFWYVNEWVPVTSSVGWQLRIGAFRFPECGSPDFTVGATPATQDICAGTNALYDVTVGSIQGYVNPVTLSASGNPAGTTTNFSTNPVVPPGSSTLTVGNTAAASAGSYNIDVVGVSQSGTHTSTVGLNVFDAAATVSLSSPANGATGVALAPTFTWTGTGTSYTIEIATDAGFTNIVETATVGGTSYTSSGLAANTTHYWRVTADNVCGGNTSAAWSFTTVDLLCSSPNVAIPDNNPAGVTNDLIVGNSGSIDDLNVSVDMTHTWVGDVIFTLQHVDTGTTVTFYDRPGVPASTFGCSGDNVDASLDDEAATPVEDECGAGVPAIAGSFIPNNPLSAFDGEDLAGTWRITASDLAGGDTGTLNTWCIDAGTSGGGGGTPDISVTPASLSSTQATNTVVVQQLTIENVGTADLDWMIDEAAPVAPAAPVSGGRSERLGTTAPSSDAKIAGGVMPHGRTDVIADGGFEAGTPNPFWNEASSNFGTPICDVVSCGQGGGTGPHAGTYWTWFGGITGVVETGSMDQNVVIPAGTATLSFYLEIPVADSTGSMNVDIDGNVLFTATEADTGTYATYAPVTLDVSAYADGGSHNVRFSSTTDAGAGPLNFFVDDVVLDVQEGGGSACDAPSDIAWLSVSPAAGTTISGTSTLVDVTFDSTGYAAGTYTGTLCVNSNDPDTPLVEVPVEMVVTDVVVNPAIVVTATVGLDPMTCATTSSLVVGQPNTDVYYCYTVENTGNITLSLHDIMDDVGTNLSGVAYDLAPGATADTVALGLTISETVTTDTTNTVVWTAYVATGASASASSTAAVTEAPTDVTLSSFGGDSATLLPLMVATLAALFVGLGLLLRRRSQTL